MPDFHQVMHAMLENAARELEAGDGDRALATLIAAVSLMTGFVNEVATTVSEWNDV